ncbi:MAG: hypothetical protein SOU19_04640 [Candidatus Caccosoma sp.]|nr:hypothetical protein [Candidatus Caccosoma sp.]
MNYFIYDYYCYNVKLLDDNTFVFKDYTFLLSKTTEDENSLNKLNELINSLYNVFDGNVVYIVKNKYNKYISSSEGNNNICMLTYKDEKNIDINYFIKMHMAFLNTFNYYVNLDDIIILWDQRLEYIQNQCLVALNFDNDAHMILYEYSQFAIGLAINALQYLSDMKIDFNKKYYLTTLTHRRIKKMDKFELFNPFNLIVDHSSRDLAELYKNNLIDFDTLFSICQSYSYNVDEYEYLIARLLFHTFIFDIIEDIATDNTMYDYQKEIYYAISKQNEQLDKLKYFYKKISQLMLIRPIDWLNSN